MAESHQAPPSGHPDEKTAVGKLADELKRSAEKSAVPEITPSIPEKATEAVHEPAEEAVRGESLEARAEKLNRECRERVRAGGMSNPTSATETEKGDTEMDAKKRSRWLWVLVVLIAIGFGWYVYEQMPKSVEAPVITSAKQPPKVDDNQKAIIAGAVNDMSDDIGGLTKEIAELKRMIAELKECACKKPTPKAPIKKVVPKPTPKAPAIVSSPPAPVTSAPKLESKADCAPSTPKPAIIRPGHMPLGALPSASCPNCK